MILSKLYVAKT